MTKRITFFGHEVESEKLVSEFMTRMGYPSENITFVAKLCRQHQFRFYENTKESTILAWMRDLGPDGWRELLKLRKADRAGNLKNKDKPLETREMRLLAERCREIEKRPEFVYRYQLKIDHDHFAKQMSKLTSADENIILSEIYNYISQNANNNEETTLQTFIDRSIKRILNEHNTLYNPRVNH